MRADHKDAISPTAVRTSGPDDEVFAPSPDQDARAEEIGASFPGWRVWYTRWPLATWNAYRKGENPYFGPPGEDGRVFMVTTRTAEGLLGQLKQQARIDLAGSA